MNRRGFLGAILAAGVAPAIGHAGILMPVRKIVTGIGWVSLYADRRNPAQIATAIDQYGRLYEMTNGNEELAQWHAEIIDNVHLAAIRRMLGTPGVRGFIPPMETAPRGP